MAHSKRGVVGNLTAKNNNKSKPSKKSNAGSPIRESLKTDHSPNNILIANQEFDEGTIELANDIQGTLVRLNREAKSRKELAERLEKQVLKQKLQLLDKITQAKGNIDSKKVSFKASMLPIITSMIQDLNQTHDETTNVELPLILKPVVASPAISQAAEVVEDCQRLMACYDSLQESITTAPSIEQTRSIFEKDRNETMKAFGVCKTFAINRLHTRLADKDELLEKTFIMDKKEEQLARKIMSLDKQRSGSSRNAEATGIGSLIYDLGKAVAKMESIAE